jgi:hypothetical protein
MAEGRNGNNVLYLHREIIEYGIGEISVSSAMANG